MIIAIFIFVGVAWGTYKDMFQRNITEGINVFRFENSPFCTTWDGEEDLNRRCHRNYILEEWTLRLRQLDHIDTSDYATNVSIDSSGGRAIINTSEGWEFQFLIDRNHYPPSNAQLRSFTRHIPPGTPNRVQLDEETDF